MGYDFGNVRVHRSPSAHAFATVARARAFTLGSDIVFNRGEWAPESARGERLLAHELAHVTQAGDDSTLRRAETEDRDSVCSGLTDIKKDVNTFVNSQLAAARVSPGVSPVVPFLREVGDRTGGSGAVSPIETFVEGLPAAKRFIPSPSLAGTRFARLPSASGLGIPSLFGMNIYDLHTSGRVHVVGSTARINGTCAGADKLGHFFQQGLQYFALAGGSGTTATAESFGRATEIDRAGLGATGVYSNADLAANLDGLRFWRDLNTTPSMTFDIASYVSSSWNEYVNPNFYEASVGSNIWASQLTGTWGAAFGSAPLSSTGVTLAATPAGAVTGSFTLPTTAPTAPITASLTGAVTQRTTPVSGSIPSSVLHGSSGAHSATPVNGVDVNFDWRAGAASGKGFWTSVNERRLDGTFGNGTSRSDRGTFNLQRP
jgi:hypothetical protein